MALFDSVSAPISLSVPKILFVQLFAVATGLGAFALAPPARGAMMLIPLFSDRGSAINIASDHGARLIAAGRLPGSIIVEGQRDALMPAMLANGIFVTAGAPLLCGPTPFTQGHAV